jgi:hypothetical protein
MRTLVMGVGSVMVIAGAWTTVCLALSSSSVFVLVNLLVMVGGMFSGML